jgi:hypothetical protein
VKRVGFLGERVGFPSWEFLCEADHIWYNLFIKVSGKKEKGMAS